MIPYHLIESKENKNFLIRNIEEILATQPIVVVKKEVIEVPGLSLMKNKNLSAAILTPENEKAYLDQKSFETVKEMALTKEKNVIFFDLHTAPAGIVRLDLEILKNGIAFVKYSNDYVSVNNFVFTTLMLEFQGTNLLTNKRAFLVSKNQLSEIKKILLKQNT